MRKVILFLIITTLIIACSDKTKTKTKQEMQFTEQKETIEVRKLGDNHWQTYTDIIINAPVEKVWKVLSNWDSLSSWSSSLKRIQEDAKNKGNILVSYLVDGNTYDTPHVLIYEEGEEFGWSDPMEGGFEGLTDNHRFRVEKISDNKTRFIQSDDFKGPGNKNLSAEDVANMTVKFFPLFNRELKQEVERTNKNWL